MTVAVLSIHPEHVAAILEGRKTIELRRVRPAREVRQLVIYETQPLSRVVAIAEVVGIDVDTPRCIWLAHRGRVGVSRARFDRYFAGSLQAVAILLGEVRPVQHLPIQALGLRTAPQSWAYLPSRLACDGLTA